MLVVAEVVVAVVVEVVEVVLVVVAVEVGVGLRSCWPWYRVRSQDAVVEDILKCDVSTFLAATQARTHAPAGCSRAILDSPVQFGGILLAELYAARPSIAYLHTHARSSVL